MSVISIPLYNMCLVGLKKPANHDFMSRNRVEKDQILKRHEMKNNFFIFIN